MKKQTYKNINDFKKSKFYRDAGKADARKKVEEEFEKKIGALGNEFGNLIENARVLYEMLMDREFKIPKDRLLLIIAGLLYFIVPTDVIPDFLPFIGFVDDAAILTMIVSSLSVLIDTYRNSKNSRDV